MDDFEKAVFRTLKTMVIGLVLFGTVPVIASYWSKYATSAAAIEAGYSQQPVLGEEGVYWVKDGEKFEERKDR